MVMECSPTFTMSRLYETVILALLFIDLLHTASVSGNSIPSSQCDEVKNAYVNMGYSSLDVPTNSLVLKDDDLEICPAGFSCCTRDMEIQLTSHSRLTYDGGLINATNRAKQKLSTATSGLHAFFTQQIAKAEKETDTMLGQAYQAQYQKNKVVVVELFNNFKKYYRGEDLDIADAIHKFFKDVFVRMFELQNLKYALTEPYLTCVGEKMDSIKPFGEYPDRLKRNLKQAFVASRTFIQGLAIGRNVATKMQMVQPTASCLKAQMKMNFCSHCRGLPTLKPCANYCLNVMKGCLVHHSELDQPWKRYIDTLGSLASRMAGEGSYNLESVLEPLKDHISSSIMEYDKNSKDIMHKIFDSNTGCGQPPNSSPERQKRSPASFVPGGRLPFRSRSSNDLKYLIEDIKLKLRDVKYLWTHTNLAGTMCSVISATTGQKCWNGESEANYIKPLVGDGVDQNKNNPEVEIDTARSDPTIVEQMSRIEEITDRILNATHMVGNVTWINLQIPLPNVTETSGETKTVRRTHFPMFDTRNYLREGSASGYKGFEDDEDSVVYSGNGFNLPPKVYLPISGSGDESPENPDFDNDDTTTTAAVKERTTKNQPTNSDGISATRKRIDIKPVKPTTTAKPSSSNTAHITISTVILSLLTAQLVNGWATAL